jgi:magnesium transporter
VQILWKVAIAHPQLPIFVKISALMASFRQTIGGMSMFSASTYFFRYLIGRKVTDKDGKELGRLKDLIADFSVLRPRILGAEVTGRDGRKIISFTKCRIANVKNEYSLIVEEAKPVSPDKADTAFLARQILGRQIIDINRKKLVRAFDLKIANTGADMLVVAVDAGIKGRLRQYGIDRFAEGLLKFFGASIPNKLLLWDNVETVNFGQAGAAMSRSLSVLDRFHPSDMADIIEEMDPGTQMEVFSAMDTERAADVLEEMESDTRGTLLESLPPEKVADVLEIMPADEVADILDEVNDNKAEELLQEMESGASSEVRNLMQYEDNEAGALMTTDYISFSDQDTVNATLEVLRKKKPEADMIYDLYIVSEKNELEASVSLRDVVISGLDARLGDIMNREVVFVHDTDPVESLNDIIDKYNLLAVPVVDANKVMLGVVIINDVVFNLLHARRKR